VRRVRRERLTREEFLRRGALLSTVEPFGFTETGVDAAEKVTTKELCKG